MRISMTPIAVSRAFAVAPVASFLLVAATGSGAAGIGRRRLRRRANGKRCGARA